MKSEEIRRTIQHGNKYPYDDPDSEGTRPTPPKDWAHSAARGILADLQYRHTIKHGFYGVDDETRAEIVSTISEIIRVAKDMP